MRPNKVDFLLAGVGGMGVLTASDIVAEVGLAAGYDVKKSEIHGFSQRGGVVESHVRWGQRVGAPMAEKGQVDFLVAFELIEAGRWLEFLHPGGTVIVNSQQVIPMSVASAGAVYPAEDKVLQTLRQVTEQVIVVNGLAEAEKLGNARLTNTVLLGALSRQLAIDPHVWLTVVERRVPPRHVESNRMAFWAGRGDLR